MAHYCICPKCKIKFNRDKIQAVKVSARRYGHATCYPDNTDFMPLSLTLEDDEDYKKIMDFVKNKFNNKANYPLIKKQIKNFQEKGYTLSGIYKSLIYFFDIKNNSVDKTNGGIGIVEYCYQDAYDYYYNLYMAEEANKNKSLITQIKEIIISPPKPKKPKYQLFKLGEFEDEEITLY